MPDYGKRFRERQMKRSEAVTKAIQKNRICGECTACCTVLGVPELSKDQLTVCQHQCATGCAIYQLRPLSCQKYSCLWRLGAIDDEACRPDRIGLIVDNIDRGPETLARKYSAITARELWANAAEGDMAAKLLAVVSSTNVVILHDEKGTIRRLMGPEEPVKRMYQEALIASQAS